MMLQIIAYIEVLGADAVGLVGIPKWFGDQLVTPVSVQTCWNSRVEGSGRVADGETLEVEGRIGTLGLLVDDLLTPGGQVVACAQRERKER